MLMYINIAMEVIEHRLHPFFLHREGDQAHHLQRRIVARQRPRDPFQIVRQGDPLQRLGDHDTGVPGPWATLLTPGASSVPGCRGGPGPILDMR